MSRLTIDVLLLIVVVWCATGVPKSLDEPMSFATFGDPEGGGWAAPFDGGPEFTSSDEDADMDAGFVWGWVGGGGEGGVGSS